MSNSTSVLNTRKTKEASRSHTPAPVEEQLADSQALTVTVPCVDITQNRKQLKALTGLRIFAAMMIVFYHSADTFGIDHKRTLASFALVQGVSLFFVLSGFILTYNYPTLATPKATLKFILMRVARIWPVHLVTALVATFFLMDKWSGHAYILLPNYLLIQGWIPIQRFFFSLNTVSWSVSVELFFYLCFPFVSAAVRSRPFRTPALCLFIAAFFIGVSRFFPPALGNMDSVASFGLAYINPLVRLFEFVVGIATCEMYFHYRNQLSRLKGTLLHVVEFSLLAVVLSFVCGVKTWFDGNALDSITPNLSTWVEASSGVLVYAALVLFLSIEKGWIQKMLSSSALVWFGEISYSVYLVHWLWIKAFVRLNIAQYHLPRMASFGLYLFLVLVSAALLHSLVEKPARSFLGRRIRSI
jgi:peptidoglycan/LPS O-acetylase OafA/YrhL